MKINIKMLLTSGKKFTFKLKYMLKIKFRLLILFFTGVISFKYFWNYDYSLRWVAIANKITNPNAYTILVFGAQLILIGEDIYKVIDTDNEYAGKIIHNPESKAYYWYNSFDNQFELLLKI